MSVQILVHHGDGYEYAVLYDTVTMWAFGPVFCGGSGEAEAFLTWLEANPGNGLLGLPGGAPRSLPDSILEAKYADFRGAMRECGDCGAWVAGECASCRAMECCRHQRSVHDEEGCGICDCENKWRSNGGAR